jgi:uncharacterized protein YkwD
MLARGYFGHQAPGGPSFAERLRDVGYAPGSAGENIASGTGLLCTPYAVFVAWLSSSGHRENLLDPDVRDLGTAVAVGRPRSLGSGATYTTDLGVRY